LLAAVGVQPQALVGDPRPPASSHTPTWEFEPAAFIFALLLLAPVV
jgi:hypothetical protein